MTVQPDRIENIIYGASVYERTCLSRTLFFVQYASISTGSEYILVYYSARLKNRTTRSDMDISMVLLCSKYVHNTLIKHLIVPYCVSYFTYNRYEQNIGIIISQFQNKFVLLNWFMKNK